VRCIVPPLGFWGVAGFENDAASDWFLLVEEALDPGVVMASAIDDVLSAAEFLEADVLRSDRCRGALRVLRRPATESAARQRGRVGSGESPRAARRRG
jgi:hypothetical protein